MSPSLWPRWTPSAPRRLASAMLSLTMKATFASAQIRCSGSASRASWCSSTSFTRSWKAAAMPGSSAALSRSGNMPPTSCGLIRYSFAGSVRSGGGKSSGSYSSSSTSGGYFMRRGLVNLVDRRAERAIELLVTLLRAEVGQKRAAEARDHARILCQLAAGILAAEATGQSDHAKHLGVENERVELAGLGRDRKLEHHPLALGQLVELLEDSGQQQIIAFRAVSALDVHLGLDNRHQTMRNDLARDLELLR